MKFASTTTKELQQQMDNQETIVPEVARDGQNKDWVWIENGKEHYEVRIESMGREKSLPFKWTGRLLEGVHNFGSHIDLPSPY